MIKPEVEALTEGWSNLGGQSRKWHYFRFGRSLCGGWGNLTAPLESGNDESPDNCAACRRKRLREIQRGMEASK